MPSTTSNLDLTVLGNITLDALVPYLDEINSFATTVETDVKLNDSVKVVVEGVTKDASAFNAASNNFETADDDTSTGVDITLDRMIKKTAFVEEWEHGKIDIEAKLRGLGKSLVYEMLLHNYNTLTAANYTNTEEVVGAATAFDHDLVLDLEVVANDADFDPFTRYLLVADDYLANLKKNGILVANQNVDADPNTIWNRYETISNFRFAGSNVIKDISGTAATENLVGFITDGSGMGVGMGIPAFEGMGDVEAQVVQDPETGFGFQIRRHYQKSTGRTYLNVVSLYGAQVVRATGLTRLVSL